MHCPCVELSTGHVFVPDAVRAITPVEQKLESYPAFFKVVGVGYVVEISFPWSFSPGPLGQYLQAVHKVRQEFIDKLLQSPSS